MSMLDLAAQNLFSPPILFFALGLLAAIVRSDLVLPESVAKGLSLYLIMAIGFKGGVEMADGVSVEVGGILLAGIVLSAFMPLIGYHLLQATTRIGRVDAAAIAAHYGSISIVTFIAANDAINALQMDPGGYMIAVAAAMEAPAILTGLVLAGRVRQGEPAPSTLSSAAAPSPPKGSIAHDSLTNGSILLLIGAFAIGWVAGPRGMEPLNPFFVDIFRGVLCLFLLDMGLTAGRGLLSQYKVLNPALIGFGIYMPLIGAVTGLGFAYLLGLSVADGALLMTLAASASYIAVPAAMKLALPEARPALSLTLSLGVTFPFNLLAGIPLYAAIAGAVLG